MGRSPCCDKVGLKKGPWTPEEDNKLLAYIEEHGHGSWRALPSRAGLQRCGKSCRLRWTNYLRPDIKRGKFSLQEEQTIIQLHALLGNRWSAIATHLPKRTDNEIKNYWNTHLKKRLAKMGIDPLTHKPKNDAILSSSSTSGQSKNSANLSHMAQWESARLEAEARLVRQSKLIGSSSSQLHHQLSSPDLNASGPLCLDVLKACNGSCEDGMMEEGEQEDWKGLRNLSHYKEGIGNSVPFNSGLQDMTMPIENGWAHEPVRPDNDEHGGMFADKFTELLLNNCGGDRSFSGESDIGDGSGPNSSGGDGDGGGCEYYEDNKNYWSSILNLVSSSPSDSPMF